MKLNEIKEYLKTCFVSFVISGRYFVFIYRKYSFGRIRDEWKIVHNMKF